LLKVLLIRNIAGNITCIVVSNIDLFSNIVDYIASNVASNIETNPYLKVATRQTAGVSWPLILDPYQSKIRD
jgi:uncharacterized protein (UPF0333 family)